MVMNAMRRDDATRDARAARRDAFWNGFLDVWRRAFSFDFFPKTDFDPRPGWQIDLENMRGDWMRVGGDMWRAIGRFENDCPEISKGQYRRHLDETAAARR